MKRKLTIAAGIIHNPKILFLDEPTTGIDVESARQIRQMIGSLNMQGTTIFLTTHYIEDAERLCNRIGFIVGGRIIKVGNTQALLTEAQKENIIEFRMESTYLGLQADLLQSFPFVSIPSQSNSTLRISSKEDIELMPFMKFFECKDIKIQEAKLIHPSLEEVFVNITGIEIDRLKKEKEGKKQ